MSLGPLYVLLGGVSGTLLIFDGVSLGNWLLFSLDFSLLNFFEIFMLCLNSKLIFPGGKEKDNIELFLYIV